MPSGFVHTGLYTRVKYTSMLLPLSLRMCGSRKLISKWARGNSSGQWFSFHVLMGEGIVCGLGTNFVQPFGMVPPFVATEPVSTLRKNRQRVIIHPPRCPAAALRQICEANAVPARAISSATATMASAGTPDSSSAHSGVYSQYICLSSSTKSPNDSPFGTASIAPSSFRKSR